MSAAVRLCFAIGIISRNHFVKFALNINTHRSSSQYAAAGSGRTTHKGLGLDLAANACPLSRTVLFSISRLATRACIKSMRIKSTFGATLAAATLLAESAAAAPPAMGAEARATVRITANVAPRFTIVQVPPARRAVVTSNAPSLRFRLVAHPDAVVSADSPMPGSAGAGIRLFLIVPE